MAKKPKSVRGKFSDEKYLGPEPDLRGDVTITQVIKAYNWYNYFYDSAQAKAWVIEYIKEFHKHDKELLKNVSRIDDNRLNNCGWNSRILLLGGTLPEDIKQNFEERIRFLAKDYSKSASTGEEDSGSEQAEEDSAKPQEVKQVISIQERINNRANDLIADIEGHIDNFYRDGTMFKPSDWLSQNDVKPAIAQKIADYYKPLYAELFDAVNGKDDQLKEAYSSWKKSELKAYMEFVKSIVSATETRAILIKVRKPRKKKEKSPVQLVAKLRYKDKDDAYKITSVDPKQIIGCNQLWVFNSKYRTLAVYNAIGPAGLGIKGSTLTGFDEKTSIVKKLRKPEEQLKSLLEGGKIVLRKFMDSIKCKSKGANGRINTETVLLRIIK